MIAIDYFLTLSEPMGLVTVTQLNSLVLAYTKVRPRTNPVFEYYQPVEAPEGTIARCRPVSVTRSTSTVGLPRESYTERAWILEMGIVAMQ